MKKVSKKQIEKNELLFKEVLEKAKKFREELQNLGALVCIQVATESEYGFTFQISSMSAPRAIGLLETTKAQLLNGIQKDHQLDATVQSLEARPDLVLRFLNAIHKGHETIEPIHDQTNKH